MSAPAEATGPTILLPVPVPVPVPVPAFGELTKWQREGWLCVWCSELLLHIPRLRLATVRDTEGWPLDLFVCEPCVLAAVEKALADDEA